MLEVRFGKILGLGAFGVVREVKDVDLLDESRYSINTSKTSECTHSSEKIHSDPQFDSDEIVIPECGVFNDSLFSRNDLAALCTRNGESRYAVKYLMTEDASAEQQARARIDLGIEIRYLRALSHPNIIKIRGLLKTQQLFDPKLFFLMDRLYGTLHDKIGKWKESVEIKDFHFMRCLLKPFRHPKNYDANRDFMKERLFIAYDIASALTYMHHNKVIHR
jgi:serine/threonine protein kinase